MNQNEKFLEDFDKKTLSDDFYPYSIIGLKTLSRGFSCVYVSVVMLIFKVIGEVAIKPLLYALDGAVNNFLLGGKDFANQSLDMMKQMSGSEIAKAPVSGGLVKFNVIFTTSDWVVRIYNLAFFAVLLIAVIFFGYYLYLVVLRHFNWETYVIRNDFEALWLKRKYLKATNIEKRLSEIKKDIKKNRKGGDSTTSDKHKVEEKRLLAHKKMNFYVNTRKAHNSPVLQKQYRAVFKLPNLRDSADKVEADLKDLDVGLRRILKGKVTFGKTETASNFGKLVSRGMVTEKRQLVPKSKVGVIGDVVSKSVKDEWATFPLSLYKDKTEEINKISKRAKEESERVAKNLASYFISVKSNLTLSEKNGIRLNAKNGIYHFVFPEFNPTIPEATTLEKALQAMLGEPSLTVAISGGVDITVPLPDDCQLPLDTAKVFRDAFESGKFKVTDTIFGVKADGKPLIKNLASLPHMIVAGTTGSGKSVALNASIHSIFVKATPDQIKFAFVDPKMVEFTPYKDNPFLFAPIVTSAENAFALLSWLANVEMDRRYELFARFEGVKNLENFNKMIDSCKRASEIFKQYKIKTYADYEKSKKEEVKSVVVPVAKITLTQPEILEMKHMEYLVCVVDEYADMGNMLEQVGSKAKSDMNDNFQRLGQKARAAGIHVWLATQRPSVKVISGDIKANFPSRYGLRVSSSTDSEVVLDTGGAENLLGRGDGLIKDESGKITRTQALFIDDDYGDGEFTKVLDYLKNKFDKPVYRPYLEEMVEKGVVEWATEKDGSTSTTNVKIVVKKGLF